MGFYGSNDPTDSVKALKEVVVLRTGFNPTRSTSPCYNPTHACNIQWYTKYKNESKHSETGPVRQKKDLQIAQFAAFSKWNWQNKKRVWLNKLHMKLTQKSIDLTNVED